MSKTTRALARIWACSFALVVGCADGLPPPAHELDFPGAIAAVDLVADSASDPTHLLVANTNFDFRYNGTNFQSINLAIANAAIDDHCGEQTDRTRCAIVHTGVESVRNVDATALHLREVDDLITSEVVIDSIAGGMSISPDGDIAYLPVAKGDGGITHIDLGEGGIVSCGGEGRHRCDRAHTRVEQGLLRAYGTEMPKLPIDTYTGRLSDLGDPSAEGNYVLTLHRGGEVTFLIHTDTSIEPLAIDVLEGLGTRYVSIERDPVSSLFLATSGQSNGIARVAIARDAQSGDYLDSQLVASSPLRLAGLNTSSANIRHIIADPRTTPPYAGRLYAVGVAPSALLVGHAGTQSDFVIDQLIDLGEQPARADLFEVGGRAVIAVSCHASRDLYFVDADLLRVIGVIRGFSGAFELAFDPPRERLYVSDYRVSVIRFVDMKPLFDCVLNRAPATDERSCSPRLLGMMGIPNAVQQL